MTEHIARQTGLGSPKSVIRVGPAKGCRTSADGICTRCGAPYAARRSADILRAEPREERYGCDNCVAIISEIVKADLAEYERLNLNPEKISVAGAMRLGAKISPAMRTFVKFNEEPL